MDDATPTATPDDAPRRGGSSPVITAAIGIAVAAISWIAAAGAVVPGG